MKHGQLLLYLLLTILACAADEDDDSGIGSEEESETCSDEEIDDGNVNDSGGEEDAAIFTLTPDNKWSEGECGLWCEGHEDVKAVWAGYNGCLKVTPGKCPEYCKICERWCPNGTTHDDLAAIARWGSRNNCMDYCLEVRPKTELLSFKFCDEF